MRLKKLNIQLPSDLGGDLIVAIDSTGMKVTNRGEWIRHKWKTHRGLDQGSHSCRYQDEETLSPKGNR